jgi:hypothetical protein
VATVYIKTTIPSYYYETRQTPEAIAWREATRRWWDGHRSAYELVTSRYVLGELALAPIPKRDQGTRLISSALVLPEPEELELVANYYIEHRAMPEEAAGDAYHLALASLHRLDFLLTWNCRHLANANKIRHLTVLNGRLGLPMPIVTTPLTLMPEE